MLQPQMYSLSTTKKNYTEVSNILLRVFKDTMYGFTRVGSVVVSIAAFQYMGGAKSPLWQKVKMN